MDHKLAGNSDGKVEEIVATWLNLPLEGSAVRVIGAVQGFGRAPPEGKRLLRRAAPLSALGRVACCGGSVLAPLGPLRAPSPAHAKATALPRTTATTTIRYGRSLSGQPLAKAIELFYGTGRA